MEFLRKVAIGFTSGTIASIVNIPFDVAKSRIQVRKLSLVFAKEEERGGNPASMCIIYYCFGF